MVTPSRRREMACESVKQRGVSITLACSAFGISQSCYRHVGVGSPENQEIANWLLRLMDSHRTWGFGLRFLYLRNVKRFGWNHKRVYRVYRQVELNLRIKPRARLTSRSCKIQFQESRLPGVAKIRNFAPCRPNRSRVWFKFVQTHDTATRWHAALRVLPTTGAKKPARFSGGQWHASASAGCSPQHN